jgi:hypothetical protein
MWNKQLIILFLLMGVLLTDHGLIISKKVNASSVDTGNVELCTLNCDFGYGNMTGWSSTGSVINVTSDFVRSGPYSVRGTSSSYGEFYRVFSLTSYASYVDSGWGKVTSTGFIDPGDSEEGGMSVSFLDASGNTLTSGWDSGWLRNNRETWTTVQTVQNIPVGARSIKVTFKMRRSSGSYTDMNVDDVSVMVRFVGTEAPTTTIVYGSVVSATTGNPISNVRVCVTSLNTCVVTNSRGAYELPGLSGVSINVSAAYSGYITSTNSVSLGSASRVLLNFALSPVLNAQSMRIVLSWGLNPRDLDSHLWIPNGTGGYSDHIFYRFRGSCVTNQLTCLDVDDITSYGPETITINRRKSGTYVYGVHHYSGLGSIATSSSAQIDVYAGSRLVRRYKVPANANRSCVQNCFWTIFRINGSTGAITDVNKFTQLRGVPLTPP